MAKIFFSMSGEGRGHATRVKAVADELSRRHEVAIFAPGDAFDLLEPAYRGSAVRVQRIPGLRFCYTPAGQLDYLRTLAGAAKYLVGYTRLRKKLERVIREEKPDLIITDFEPSLPRAAKRVGVPFISLNHQHFLIVNDLSGLPAWLRRHARIMSLVVRSYYQGQARTIVSSFYFPPLKAKYRDVVQVGVILRPAVLNARRSRDGHLVAYLRKFATRNVLAALRQCGMPVKVYGLGKRPTDGNLTYEEVSESRFVEDLATCEALVSTAGNQLVGEALYLGKPVLAMPEPNNHEQYINAFYLKEEGTGDWVELESMRLEHLQGFLAKLDEYRSKIRPEKFNGNPLALQAVEEFLSRRIGKPGQPRSV